MTIALQIVLALVALICLLGGLNLLNKGAMAFLPKDQPPAKELDNLFRFTSGIYFAMGILLVYVVFTINEQHGLLYFLGNVVFFAGLGRAVSMLRVGSAGNYHRNMMVLEMGLGRQIIVLEALR